MASEVIGARGVPAVPCHDLVDIRDEKGKPTGDFEPGCKPLGSKENLLAKRREDDGSTELHVCSSAVNKGNPVKCAICGAGIADSTLALVPA